MKKWIVDNYTGSASAGSALAVFPSDGSRVPIALVSPANNITKEDRENAKLIAQAPELLMACKRVVAAWPLRQRKNLASAMAHVRAVIAKAEGVKP